MLLQLKVKTFLVSLPSHGWFFSTASSRNPILLSTGRRLREAPENLSMLGVSLPLLDSLHPFPHRHLHCSFRQVSSILPRALSFSTYLQAQLLQLRFSLLSSYKSSFFMRIYLFLPQLKVTRVFTSKSRSRSLPSSFSQKCELGRKRYTFVASFYNSSPFNHDTLSYSSYPRPHLRQLPIGPISSNSCTSVFRSFSSCTSRNNELGMKGCNLIDNAESIGKIIDDSFNSNLNTESLLTEHGVGPTQELVISVLDRYRYKHKPAYRFFKWAGSVPGFDHDFVTYIKMLDILAKTRQFGTMVEFLEEMGNSRFLSMESFKIAIQSFAAARERKKCQWIFQLMKKCGFDTGLDTLNCLLDHLVKVNLGKEAHNLFDKMKGHYKPDLKTYTILLYGWCKAKNLAGAGRVWNELFDSNIKPDIIAYNIMIQGLILGQRRQEAMKLFDFMKAKGPNPNLCTYTMIIRDLCKGGKMDLAIRVFEEMKDSGFEPDLGIYKFFLTGFGNIKKMDKVSSLFDEMTEMGLEPDSRIYNALIKLMTSRNILDEASLIYKMMVKNGVVPTIKTYNMIMKSYFSKNYEMGCQVWYEMKNKGINICPDRNSYAIFIRGHIKYGKVEEAEKYILEMVNKGMKIAKFDYNKFVADFSRVGKPDKLRELAEKISFGGNFEASNLLNHLAEKAKTR